MKEIDGQIIGATKKLQDQYSKKERKKERKKKEGKKD